jgi:hypothetical protein
MAQFSARAEGCAYLFPLEVTFMAETLTKFTLTAEQGETVYTDWIDVRHASRLRLLIGPKEGGRYAASISQSTVDPAQNTPIVYYNEQFICGQTENLALIPQSEIFVRKDQLGANFIKVALTNVSADFQFDVYLLMETDSQGGA